MNRKDKLRKKAKDEQHKREKHIEALRSRINLTVVGAKPQECGDCQACCEVIAIEAFGGKENYQKCQHQCETGCGVYAERPDECKRYYCMWQQGYISGGPDMRPDKLGVLVDFRPANGNRTGNVVEAMVFWETRPGALKEPKVKELMQRCRAELYPKGGVVMWNEYNSIPHGERTVNRKPS